MRRHRIYDPTAGPGQKPITPEAALRLAHDRQQQPDLTKLHRAMAAAAKRGAVRAQVRRRAK